MKRSQICFAAKQTFNPHLNLFHLFSLKLDFDVNWFFLNILSFLKEILELLVVVLRRWYFLCFQAATVEKYRYYFKAINRNSIFSAVQNNNLKMKSLQILKSATIVSWFTDRSAVWTTPICSPLLAINRMVPPGCCFKGYKTSMAIKGSCPMITLVPM